jgi:hypothetical protein
VSPIGWCLHNILLSWCSSKEIGVSSRLVLTIFCNSSLVHIDIYKDNFLWFSPTRVSKLNSMYYDSSLHAFIVLNLMNY